MNPQVAILAGATGLVGRAILAGLLADSAVAHVHCVGRRPPPLVHKKITAHGLTATEVPPLPPASVLYLALGTTIKTAGSQAVFRQVDHALPLALAVAALQAGVSQIGLVSSVGAHAGSSNFDLHVKGELEQALKALAPPGLVIAQPSLLLGNRAALGQPLRRAERWGQAVGRLLGPCLPVAYRPIEATKVAAALRQRVPTARGVVVLGGADLQQAAPGPTGLSA